jgi:hypothetical protein
MSGKAKKAKTYKRGRDAKTGKFIRVRLLNAARARQLSKQSK